MAKLSKKLSGIFITVFIIGFLTLTLIREKGEISFHENRRLAEMPEILDLKDGKYFEKLEKYFSDHFAFRSKLVNINSKTSLYIGEPIINGVYVSGGMMLNADKRNNITEWKSAEAINEYAEKSKGSVYVMAVPASDGIYIEKLPEYLRSITQKSQIDSFYASLNTGVKKIDAYNTLKMLNENYIYYRNDTKWTSYGAFCVYRTAIQKLGFLPVTYDKYKIEHAGVDFRGDLYNKTLYTDTKADMIDVYVCINGKEVVDVTAYDSSLKEMKMGLYHKEYLQTNDPYSFYLGGEDVIKIKTDVGNDKKLLVIKDEYADCFIPFLTQHYSEIAVVSGKCRLSDYAEVINPDEYGQTLFLFGADNLVNENCIASQG